MNGPGSGFTVSRSASWAAGVGDVEYVRRPAENQRPFVRTGNRPETVFPRGERLPADHHVPAQGDRGGRVGAWTPHLAPRHDSSPPEERPAAGARPVVHDRYLSRAQGLGHGCVLALRTLRWQDRRRQQKHGQLHRVSATTGFRSTPTPGISTSTTSPGASGPTPAGVPVAIRSPGSRVMTCENAYQRDNGKHHVARPAVLALLAVHAAVHLQLIESPRVHRHHAGADGAERVEAFRAGPLLVGPLQVSRGHVVDARDPGDAGARFALGCPPERPSDDDADFAFEVDLPRFRWQHDRRAVSNDG